MFLKWLFGGGSRGARAATPENPSFNLNDPEAWDALGASPTSTGMRVSAEKALTWSAWWRGVTLLARGVAKAPCHVYKTDPNGEYGATLDLKHPAYNLLRHKPNEYQTAFQFKLALMGHAVNRGNGYAYIFRAGPEPVELVLLDPDDTEPVMMNGQLWYVTKVEGTERKLPAADVFHLKGFGCDGFRGYPLWQIAREVIGQALTREKYTGTRYKNSARPSVVLSTDGKVDNPARERLRSEWERMHTGIDNAHRTAILDNGLKISTLAFTPEEMQEVESAGLLLRDAANFLGIPSSKLGDVEGVKYASKEADDRNFLEDGLDFWLNAFEAEGRDKLLLESEKEANNRLVAFDRDALISFDLQTKANYFRTATGGRGWMSPAEVREREKLEPRDEPDIDKILTPLNMGQGGANNQPEKPSDNGPGRPKEGAEAPAPTAVPSVDPPAAQAPPLAANTIPHQMREAARASITDAARRMCRRIAHQATRAATSGAKFVAWVDSFANDEREVIAEAFGPANHILGAMGERPHDPNEYLIEVLRGRYWQLADTAKPRTLAADVEKLNADLEAELPTEMCEIFLPDPTPTEKPQ